MENFEKVALLDNEVQARLLDSVLASRGIPHIMVSYRDSANAGLSPGPRGWGYVEATEHYWDEIVALLEDIKHRPEAAVIPAGGPAKTVNRAGL